jgi:hypothetical protein
MERRFPKYRWKLPPSCSKKTPLLSRKCIKHPYIFCKFLKNRGMKCKIYENLLTRKNSPFRKPLVLMGARQVGKSYIYP